MSDQVWGLDREFASNHRSVTLSNTVDLPQPMLIYCNAAGDVSVADSDNVSLVYTVTAGQVIPVIARRVNATGTTVAANTLIGLY